MSIYEWSSKERASELAVAAMVRCVVPEHEKFGRGLRVTVLETSSDRARREEELRAVVRQLVAPSTAASLATGMATFVRLTSSLPLLHLARWERLIRTELRYAHEASAIERSGSRALFPAFISNEKARSNRFPSWIDVVSFDGHLRERALRTFCGPAPNAFVFCMAALRLNDWVPQVRAAARDAVRILARASDPEHVVDALCALLPTWSCWGRLEPLDKQALTGLLTLDGLVDSLERKIITDAAGPASAVLAQALRADALDSRLMQIAAQAVQPAVRARAYRVLLTSRADWVEGERWQWTDLRYCKGHMEKIIGHRPLTQRAPLLELLKAAAADRSSIVRRVAAAALIREMSSLGAEALPLARSFAADTSRPVAERGQFALQQLTSEA